MLGRFISKLGTASHSLQSIDSKMEDDARIELMKDNKKATKNKQMVIGTALIITPFFFMYYYFSL